MTWQAINWVREHAPESGGDLLVLLALANQTRDTEPEGGFRECWPSIDTLAWESRLTTRAVYSCLQRMENSGRLTIEHGGNGPKDTNSYTINTTNPRPPRKSRKMAKGEVRARKGEVASPSKGEVCAAKGEDASPEPVQGTYPEEQTSSEILRTRSVPERRKIKRTPRKYPEGKGLTTSASEPRDPASDSGEINQGADETRSHGGKSWGDSRDLARYFAGKDWGDIPDPVNERKLGGALKRWIEVDQCSPVDIVAMIDLFHNDKRYWRESPLPPWHAFLGQRKLLRNKVNKNKMYVFDEAKAMELLDQSYARALESRKEYVEEQLRISAAEVEAALVEQPKKKFVA
ncbi:MAG TPA: hypothetical protein VK988_03050 [Acidimicrobiales bacterium]|nr:hypothetical protein [Acidimicrobiales bacterium]